MKVVLRSPSLIFLMLGIIFDVPVAKVKRQAEPEAQKSGGWKKPEESSAPDAPHPLMWRRRT